MTRIYSHDGYMAADADDIAAAGESAYAHACRIADEGTNMQIEDIKQCDLASLCAALVREGVNFRAFPTMHGLWCIEFDGGH